MVEIDKKLAPEIYVDTDDSGTAQVAVQGKYFNRRLDPNATVDTMQSRSVQGQVVYHAATNDLSIEDINQTPVHQRDLRSVSVSETKDIDVTIVSGQSPKNFFKKMRSTPGIDVEEGYIERGAKRGYRMTADREAERSYPITKDVDEKVRRNGGDPEAQVPKRGGFAMKQES